MLGECLSSKRWPQLALSLWPKLHTSNVADLTSGHIPLQPERGSSHPFSPGSFHPGSLTVSVCVVCSCFCGQPSDPLQFGSKVPMCCVESTRDARTVPFPITASGTASGTAMHSVVVWGLCLGSMALPSVCHISLAVLVWDWTPVPARAPRSGHLPGVPLPLACLPGPGAGDPSATVGGGGRWTVG